MNLVTAFVGLEMSSISTYVLAGFRRRALQSNEASLKYFLLGSFATAFFLYGIAMTYGATGTTRIDAIQAAFQTHRRQRRLAILGLGLMFVGLGFKVVVAPFQIYAPDVYEGAPTPVTALLASAPKAATFAVMVRIFYVAFGVCERHLVLGDLDFGCADDVHRQFCGAGADQRETHAGVFLDRARGLHSGGVRRVDGTGRGGGSFLSRGVCADESGRVSGGYRTWASRAKSGSRFRIMRGWARSSRCLAVCFSLFLLSLLGLPATGGFLGKFFAFQAALDVRDHGSSGWW